MYYTDIGESDHILVWIHGAGSSRLAWPPVLRRIPGWRVLTLDLPGHGRSEGAGKTSVADYAADVRHLLETLDGTPIIVGGHSMGGAITQQIALTHPIDALILIGTGAHFKINQVLLDTILEDKTPSVEFIDQWAWAPGSPEELRQAARDVLWEVPAEVLHADYVACHHVDLRQEVAQISQPTLVIGGSIDKMTPYKLSQYLAETIPQATLKTVEGGGHWMMLEQPNVVGQYVIEWLEQFRAG